MKRETLVPSTPETTIKHRYLSSGDRSTPGMDMIFRIMLAIASGYEGITMFTEHRLYMTSYDEKEIVILNYYVIFDIEKEYMAASHWL